MKLENIRLLIEFSSVLSFGVINNIQTHFVCFYFAKRKTKSPFRPTWDLKKDNNYGKGEMCLTDTVKTFAVDRNWIYLFGIVYWKKWKKIQKKWKYLMKIKNKVQMCHRQLFLCIKIWIISCWYPETFWLKQLQGLVFLRRFFRVKNYLSNDASALTQVLTQYTWARAHYTAMCTARNLHNQLRIESHCQALLYTSLKIAFGSPHQNKPGLQCVHTEKFHTAKGKPHYSV